MAFQIFTSYGAASRSEATLRASGYLFLPRAMMLGIGADSDTTKVVLLYDAAQSLLAIRLPRFDDFENAQRDVSQEKSGTAVNIVPLLKTMKLVRPKKKLSLPVEQQDDMLVVNMTSALEILN